MTDGKLRLAFAGTPVLAKTVLESIHNAGRHSVQNVFTQPDRPAGRGRKMRPSEVKLYAVKQGLTLFQPATADGITPEALGACDVLLVVAYGLLIKRTTLTAPKYGCINIHTSLLPRWRGAAPIQRAIEAGDRESGITVMRMDEGLDTGPIYKQYPCPVSIQDTGATLHDKLAALSAKHINQILTEIANGALEPAPQDHARATYANKITKREADLDWHQPASGLHQKIRAFNPVPGAHTVLNKIPMRVWEAEVKNTTSDAKPGEIIKATASLDVMTAAGILSITKLQLPGRKIVSAGDFLNGHPDFFT